MDKPDQRLFEADLASAQFRAGAQKGYWGFPGTDLLPEQPAWPLRILWVAAAPRSEAPNRFYLQLDLADYRTASPTGTFSDYSIHVRPGFQVHMFRLISPYSVLVPTWHEPDAPHPSPPPY